MTTTSIPNRTGHATFESIRATLTPRRTTDGRNASVEFDQVNLFQSLNRVATQCSNLEELLVSGGEVICCQSECLGLWFARQAEADAFAEPQPIVAEPGAMPWKTVQSVGRNLLRLAAVSRQIQTARLPRHAEYQLIVVPVIFGDQVDTVIAGCFHDVTDVPHHNQWLLGILAQSVSNWLAQDQLKRGEFRARSLSDVVSLIRAIDRASTIHSASVILVNQIKRLTQAQQVAFASCNSEGLPKLLAVSDVETIDAQFEGIKTMTQACGQAMQCRRVLVYPDRSQNRKSADTLALKEYCRSGSFGGCISIPLIAINDQLIGALLIAVSTRQAKDVNFTQYLGQVANMIAGHLQLMLRANRSLWQHSKARIHETLSGKSTRIALALALSVVALMLLPWPYRVACNCEIQPVLRRFIAAPHDGVLETNLVENGDVVKREAAVAKLDGRQLRIELAGLEAELQGAAKKRSAAMANGQIAEAQIALSQINKLNAEISLVRDKLENLEIRSPIDGFIVAGDLEKVEGAPVEMGQTLFEVAPLDRMLAEIAVPEQEIPYVQAGMSIRIKLNAFPFETWTGTIAKIHARSEVRDQDSVFVAEVELNNEDLKLKPGMQGRAKVIGKAYPLGWNLFHRPLEQLRYWTIW